MAGFRVEGNTSGNVAEVDANHNLNVTLPTNPAYSGYAILAGEMAESTDPTGRIVQDIRTSAQGRLSVGQPVMLFNEVFNYTTLNTSQWNWTITTLNVGLASGTLQLNSTGVNTANGALTVRTNTYFPFQVDLATYGLWSATLTQTPQVNCTVEMGFGQVVGTNTPTDGAFFRYDSAGVLKAVLNSNSTEYTSSAITAPSTNVMHWYKIVVENDSVYYYIDGACVARIVAPTGLGYTMFAQAQPWYSRMYHGASTPTLANILKLGSVYVGLQDSGGLTIDYPTQMVHAGRNANLNQPGTSTGITALYSNNLAAGAGAAMTNTTAALGTGLGGQFSALPTLTAGTDGIVCSYLNPAASTTIPGKNLIIRGVRIQGGVTTVLAGGPVLYAYSLAYGHTALAMTTAEASAGSASSAKGPRRIPLGLETYGNNAAAGTIGAGVYMPFAVPVIVAPGEYVAICAKNLGTVTTTGVITFLVTFDAYFE